MSAPAASNSITRFIDDHAVLKPEMGVKAAGGIKNLADAQRMVAAGATRLGASAGVKIAQEEQSL